MSLIPLILFSNSILYELRHKSYQIKHCMIMDHMPNVFFLFIIIVVVEKVMYGNISKYIIFRKVIRRSGNFFIDCYLEKNIYYYLKFKIFKLIM